MLHHVGSLSALLRRTWINDVGAGVAAGKVNVSLIGTGWVSTGGAGASVGALAGGGILGKFGRLGKALLAAGAVVATAGITLALAPEFEHPRAHRPHKSRAKARQAAPLPERCV